MPELTGMVALSAAAYHSLALADDGSVRSWGWNAFGQLRDGTTVQRDRPVVVPGLTGVVALAQGAWLHAVVLTGDGAAWAWGWNGFGQLGDGSTIERHIPVRVAGGNGLMTVGAGPYHSLAVDRSGAVQGWGWNNVGQLGDRTTVDRHSPVPIAIPGVPGAVVAGGVFHSLAA